MVLKKGIADAVNVAVEAVKKNSKQVSGTDDIARVATVSSQDEFIGKLIAEAMERLQQTVLSQLRNQRQPKHTARLLRV